MIIAVLAVSGEYSTGMIRITLTAMPRRLTVLAAKAVLVAGLVLAVSAVAVLACVLAGRLILPGHGFTPAHGYPPLSLATGPVLRAASGSVLYLALIALLSLGVATAVRESAVAIGLVLGLLYLFPIVASVAGNQHWQRHLEQIGPMTAGLVHPGHQQPEQPAAHPLAGPRRACSVGGRRAHRRRPDLPLPRRLSSATRPVCKVKHASSQAATQPDRGSPSAAHPSLATRPRPARPGTGRGGNREEWPACKYRRMMESLCSPPVRRLVSSRSSRSPV